MHIYTHDFFYPRRNFRVFYEELQGMIAGVIGATGYAGAEAVRLLAGHPRIDRLALASVSHEGERIEHIYPGFLGRISALLERPDTVIAVADVIFSALPTGVGEPYVKAAVERGISCIGTLQKRRNPP